MSRGEIWMHTFRAPDKRRPVVVLSRDDAIGVLHSVIVAPITSTIRGLPSEVQVGTEHGLKTASVVNLDHVQSVHLRDLRKYVGSLSAAHMRAVCRALGAATGCA